MRLPYAEEHLTELFQEARAGEDVIIVRRDGRIVPVAARGRYEGANAGVEEIQDSGVEAGRLFAPV